MRKWHRWLSLFFGIFMLFIAATGLLSHWAALWPVEEPTVIAAAQAHEGEVQPGEGVAPAASSPATAQAATDPAAPPPGFECPEGWRCSPPRPTTGPRAWVGFFHHLHSGEEFGPIGTAISILSGFALLFFSFSGLWLYFQMWNQRRQRQARDRWFWK